MFELVTLDCMPETEQRYTGAPPPTVPVTSRVLPWANVDKGSEAAVTTAVPFPKPLSMIKRRDAASGDNFWAFSVGCDGVFSDM